MTLKEASIGSTVTVKKITGTGPVKRRIMDMGITKGVEIYIRKVATFPSQGRCRNDRSVIKRGKNFCTIVSVN